MIAYGNRSYKKRAGRDCIKKIQECRELTHCFSGIKITLCKTERKVERMLETGIKGCAEFTADEEGSARMMGSGALSVLATPKMIAMLEKAAWESVQPFLEEGCGTVGTLMNVTHDAATPLGMKVVCKTELTAIDGKKLTFHVEAFDEMGHIGGGVHERFIINNDRFQEKADAKNRKELQ